MKTLLLSLRERVLKAPAIYKILDNYKRQKVSFKTRIDLTGAQAATFLVLRKLFIPVKFKSPQALVKAIFHKGLLPFEYALAVFWSSVKPQLKQRAVKTKLRKLPTNARNHKIAGKKSVRVQGGN